jgi:hypothetical protein
MANKSKILTIEQLALELCQLVLEQDEADCDEIVGKAAFLQAVIDGAWGTMEGFEPVYHEDEFIGVREIE